MTVQSNCVFDLGMHKGEDTAFYLALGFDVVAFEASPDLVEDAERRFAQPLASGRLTIVPGAIADQTADEVTFYRNKWKPVWSTTSGDWASRNARMLRGSEAITVKRTDFSEVMQRYGTPFYMKIDIEGAEDLILDELGRRPDRPPFISLESEKVDFKALVERGELLRRLGYTRFKAVQQANIPGRTLRLSCTDGSPLSYTFEAHASGPFGDDVEGDWQTFPEVLSTYHRIFEAYERFGDGTIFSKWGRPVTKAIEKAFGICLPGWHDLHAAL